MGNFLFKEIFAFSLKMPAAEYKVMLFILNIYDLSRIFAKSYKPRYSGYLCRFYLVYYLGNCELVRISSIKLQSSDILHYSTLLFYSYLLHCQFKLLNCV